MILQILDNDGGIKISVSEQILPRKSADQALLGILIQSMSTAFLNNDLKAMEIFDESDESKEQMHKIQIALEKRVKEKYKSE